MSTDQVKRCDVFRTVIRDVEEVTVTVSCKGAKVMEDKKDLCPRAIDRLKRFIDKGMTPPGSKDASPKP